MQPTSYDSVSARSAAEAQISDLMLKLGVTNAPGQTSLGSELDQMQYLKNNRFPRHMYHATLKPAVAINQLQVEMLVEHGYMDRYQHRHYPAMLFRRNMAEKFACPANGAHDIGGVACMCNEFVETVTVQDPADEARVIAEERRLMGLKRLKTVHGGWVPEHADIAPLPETSDEDPDVTIARLSGELAGLKGETPAQAVSAARKRAPARSR